MPAGLASVNVPPFLIAPDGVGAAAAAVAVGSASAGCGTWAAAPTVAGPAVLAGAALGAGRLHAASAMEDEKPRATLQKFRRFTEPPCDQYRSTVTFSASFRLIPNPRPGLVGALTYPSAPAITGSSYTPG